MIQFIFRLVDHWQGFCYKSGIFVRRVKPNLFTEKVKSKQKGWWGGESKHMWLHPLLFLHLPPKTASHQRYLLPSLDQKTSHPTSSRRALGPSGFVYPSTQTEADRSVDVFPNGVWWFGKRGKGLEDGEEGNFRATQAVSQAQWGLRIKARSPWNAGFTRAAVTQTAHGILLWAGKPEDNEEHIWEDDRLHLLLNLRNTHFCICCCFSSNGWSRILPKPAPQSETSVLFVVYVIWSSAGVEGRVTGASTPKSWAVLPGLVDFIWTCRFSPLFSGFCKVLRINYEQKKSRNITAFWRRCEALGWFLSSWILHGVWAEICRSYLATLAMWRNLN